MTGRTPAKVHARPDARATRVLASVVALQLIAETALTPYWPQLLAQLFAERDFSATGGYLTACRFAGLAALPLWGLAARRWPVPRLLVLALLSSAVLDLAVAVAPSLLLFTVASAAVVATGSALVLAYPALVAVADRSGRTDRLGAVLLGVAIVQAASLLATLLGAAVVALPSPRWGLAAFAVADLLLAGLVWRRVAVPTTAPSPPPTADVTVRTRRARRPGRGATIGVPVAVVLLLAVLSDTGFGVPRPFFTVLVLDSGGNLPQAAVLFLLPAAGALAVLPAARRLQAQFGHRLLPLAAALAAGALIAQALTPTALGFLAAGRLALGAGLGLFAVALDLRIFASVGTGGGGFAVVETARSAALLVAPLLATAAAQVELILPLLVGGGLLAATALVAVVAPPIVAQPVVEEPRAREHRH